MTDPTKTTAENEFETETMARIYADQGHYQKALAIYQRLSAQHPDRQDLKERIRTVENLQKQASPGLLSDRFSEWFDLLLKKKQIDKLCGLRKSR